MKVEIYEGYLSVQSTKKYNETYMFKKLLLGELPFLGRLH